MYFMGVVLVIGAVYQFSNNASLFIAVLFYYDNYKILNRPSGYTTSGLKINRLRLIRLSL